MPVKTAHCHAFAALLVLTGAASAQVTKLVSLSSAGTQGDAASFSPVFSSRGRYVAFYSDASNLVPGDTNDDEDIFLRDTRTGTTTRVSVDSTGAQANWGSYSPSISADGRYVAFYSEASNLVVGDSNGANDVFVHDVKTGITTRVSVDSAGIEGDERSFYCAISATGRYVAFDSLATNLVPGDTNGWQDVFVHDRLLGTTTRVSVDSSGAQGNDASNYPGISADGKRVVFDSRSNNLVAGDTNGSVDIFVHDLTSGVTLCASVDPTGLPGNSGNGYTSISGDGRVVAFTSGSTNLVLGDTNKTGDVFVRDLVTGQTTRVSVSTAGVEGNGFSTIQTATTLSFDGRFVAFKSLATNLVPNDTNGMQDVFLHDVRLGTTTRMNVDSQGNQALGGTSSTPAISTDGRFVGFYSFAANLVPGDLNGQADVFLRRLW